MSENNFFNLIMKDAANHPEVGDLSKLDEKLAADLAARQKLDAANTLRRETAQGINAPRAIYNQLRKESFDLTEQARGAETRVNNEEANVRMFQSQIEDLLRRKKKADGLGQLGEVRNIERGILAQENELLNARERLLKLQRDNHACVNALKNWKTANSARLAELQKLVG